MTKIYAKTNSFFLKNFCKPGFGNFKWIGSLFFKGWEQNAKNKSVQIQVKEKQYIAKKKEFSFNFFSLKKALMHATVSGIFHP